VDPKYDPYPRAIFVYDNRFKGGGDSPDGLELKTLKTAMFGINGHFPDILWDGYVDAKNQVNGLPPAEDRICVRNGGVEVLERGRPEQVQEPRKSIKRRFSASCQARCDRTAAQLVHKGETIVAISRAVGLLRPGHRLRLRSPGTTCAFLREGRPANSATGRLVYAEGGKLALNAGVIAYDLNTPLFSDYAHKLRTV